MYVPPVCDIQAISGRRRSALHSTLGWAGTAWKFGVCELSPAFKVNHRSCFCYSPHALHLFQVEPLDPIVIVLAAISIFLLALAASVISARRAASVELMQALRAE